MIFSTILIIVGIYFLIRGGLGLLKCFSEFIKDMANKD